MELLAKIISQLGTGGIIALTALIITLALAPVYLMKHFGKFIREIKVTEPTNGIGKKLDYNSELLTKLAEVATRQTAIMEGVAKTQDQQSIVIARIDTNLTVGIERQVTTNDLHAMKPRRHRHK